MKRVIWSNMNLDIEDWRDGYKEFLEINDREIPEEIDDDDIYRWMEETNSEYLGDEQMNCDVKTDGRIIAIADLGFWNGRKMGYKLLEFNVSNCLYLENGCDYAEFYCDRYDLKSAQSHHDGIHYITYRELKPTTTPDQIDHFLSKIYDGEVTRKDITKYTRSLKKYIKDIYGWR